MLNLVDPRLRLMEAAATDLVEATRLAEAGVATTADAVPREMPVAITQGRRVAGEVSHAAEEVPSQRAPKDSDVACAGIYTDTRHGQSSDVG